MIQVFKKLIFSRKYWVFILSAALNAAVTQLNLPFEIQAILIKGISAVAATLIGSIAYEDGKTKEFGPAPIVK